MPNPNIQQLNWVPYNNAPTSPDVVLVNLLPVTFGTASGNNNPFTVVPQGQYQSLGIVPADGIVIDNLLTACVIQVSAGLNVVEIVPPYSKATLTLGAGITVITIAAVIPAADNTGVTNFIFFKGSFPGSDRAIDVFTPAVKTNANVPTNNSRFTYVQGNVAPLTILTAPPAPFQNYLESVSVAVVSTGRSTQSGTVQAGVFLQSLGVTRFGHTFVALAKAANEPVIFPTIEIVFPSAAFLPLGGDLTAVFTLSGAQQPIIAINACSAVLVPGSY